MIGLPLPLPVITPGLDVTVYDVMALPPLDAGAENVTDADEVPAVAVPIRGIPGTL